MFNLIGALFSGLFIGVLARWFYPGAVHMGLLMTILLGVGGSLLAGLVANRGSYGEGFNRAGCLASVIGAIVLIFIGRTLGWHF
ncbi:MAG: GlsB/YeaQ/YmgE family stress response membrane protein [Novosphingobium sp.]